MESLVHYSNPSHAPSVLGVLNEQRLRGQMCDIVLAVADQRFQAHRSVLAASSEYFQSMFTQMDAEAMKVVNLDFCEPDAFEIVLNYMYSSSLFVDKGSLAAIQELGYSLGIPFLTNIVSTRPHMSYCVSRKRLSFSEEDENDGQTRSVIVCQVRNYTSLPSHSNYQRKTSERSSSPHSTREPAAQPPSEHNSHESIRNSESITKKSAETSEDSDHNGSSNKSSPLVLRSMYPSRYDEETQVEGEVCVKAEPSSPLADPLEIIRITVGDTLPVNLKDFQTNDDQGSRPDCNPLGKRKGRTDNRRYPFKKTRGFKEHPLLPLDESMSEEVPRSASMDSNENTGEPQQNNIFKCWNCLKVFRSSAGLHRHVNMYHNPKKPYACDICHKRFHTNFKVWTHCQTQHGVVQNPSSSSSSSVLDEKFKKKLIDIVREREIKKALLWKLKRNKQGLQSSTRNKKRSRTKFICSYCGKVFLFYSQYKQHLRIHPAEKAEQDTARESILFLKQDELIQQKNTDAGVYSCRLCKVKLSSLFEQGDHERGCRHATVCPYCGLRFSCPTVKKDHEAHCKYKKLTCLECMQTFKSSFSIWRHQVEVHSHNMMTVKDQMSLKQQENNGEASDMLGQGHYSDEPLATGSSTENINYSDSSGPPMYDSEDSSSHVPEDPSMGHYGKLVVKEEPIKEAVSERENAETAKTGPEEPGVWPCEKCGTLFSSRKDLERHQERLCHIKPFICHICNKAFRTNFRLWSHFQSHMSTADEAGAKEVDRRPSSLSPSPPMTPQISRCPSPQASVLKPAQTAPVAAAVAEESRSPKPCSSSVTKIKRPEVERQPGSHSPLSRSNSMETPAGPQESNSLSALTFKMQYMCKICHRTFKTAFSLWSHEQSHGHM